MSIWNGKTPRHCFSSYCASIDDDKAAQNFKDIEFVCDIISLMDKVHFNIDRSKVGAWAFDIRFGEHYRLFAALTELFDPKTIVEIGTATGASARSFLDFSSNDAKFYTFDVIPWNQFDFAGGTWITEDDFASGKLTQYLDDLSKPAMFNKHSELLASADLIFCDAPKDGKFEYELFEKFAEIKMPYKERYLILDDIKFLNMAALWRKIDSPKIDLTSFGHWSGTGLVDISNGINLKS